MIQMTISDAARKQITEPFEGLRTKAYRDAVGVWTVGYGHTSRAGAPTVAAGLIISSARADEILDHDLDTFSAGVSSLLKHPATQNQFDALDDLAFNIGLPHFKSSTVLRRFNAGDIQGAAASFAAWNKAGGRVLDGLVRRRAAEKNWFLSLPAAAPKGLLDLPPQPEDMAHTLDHPDSYSTRVANRLALAWG